MSSEQRYLEPGWLVSRVINPALMRLGITPTLAVRGRTSGEWRTVPVNVLVVRPYFRALPNAADHPVFRIERS